MTSLSSQERTVIQTLLELNYSVHSIARFIKRSPLTVSIAIHQVTPYKAEIAHALALKKRHLRGRHDTLTPAIAVFLNHHIGILKWSPETEVPHNCWTKDPMIVRYFFYVKIFFRIKITDC